MQRSYLVKSPVNFADFGFFVKVGDILVHNTSNANQMTVYRNGEAVKTIQQTALGIAAFVKTGFIVEVTQQAKKAPAKPVEPAKPLPKPKQAEPKREAPAPGVPILKPEFDKLKESAKKPKPEVKPLPVEIEDETV